MTKRKIEYWVIPPDQDAEFVADMENVLETYAEAYDPQQPVICMDEQPVQLLKETKVPIAATKKHAKRVDYELSDEPMPERPPHWRTCHCCKLRSGSGPTRPTPNNAAWTGNSKSTMPEQN
jgi:hypothetical protein